MNIKSEICINSYDIMNQFIDSFVDQMVLTHHKLQINEPSSESYPDVDLCKFEKEIIRWNEWTFRWL